MIGSFFRIAFFSALGLVLSWGAFLFLPGMSQGSVPRDEAWYSESFPTRSVSKEGSDAPSRSGPLAVLLPSMVPALHSARSLIARRLAVSRALLPFWALFLAASVLAGALLRERLHLGTTHASPTVSFLSKRLAEASLLAFFLWSFSPVPLPYWVFYPALLTSMVATTGYLAHLPLRL